MFGNKFFQAPPMTKVWIPEGQQMSNISKTCLNIILIFFCAPPIYLFFFLFLLLFILSLIILLFFLVLYDSSRYPAFLLFVWHGLYLWLLFFFLYMCSLLALYSSLLVVILSCCSACFSFECTEQQATSNETHTLRITKKQVLNMLTFAKSQESTKCS